MLPPADCMKQHCSKWPMLSRRSNQPTSPTLEQTPHSAATATTRKGPKRPHRFFGTRPLWILLASLIFWFWLQIRPPWIENEREAYAANRTSSKLEGIPHTISKRSGLSHTETFAVPSGNITISSTVKANFRQNAVVLLGQKKHSTYGRDSYGLLLKAFGLLADNYLSINNHGENLDVYLFHTGDFDDRDLFVLEPLLKSRRGLLKLVNLEGSSFWMLPSWHAKDNQSHWVDSNVFPLGYRHMCRWFGVKIWKFFQDANSGLGSEYRYIMRLDEDSYVLSPIRYDIFDYMKANNFVYGYRMCAYELEYNHYIAPWWNRWKRQNPPKREISRDLCGFYNNFFVADLQFFTSEPVNKYLKSIDRQGFVYRKRYGDLMIHSTAVYSFADASRIHRFLDFTYQHVTTDHIVHPAQGCVVWGGIQAGYADKAAEKTLAEYMKVYVTDKKCTANVSYMEEPDLSPSYQHVPDDWKGHVKLKTIAAGRVEVPNKGTASG